MRMKTSKILSFGFLSSFAIVAAARCPKADTIYPVRMIAHNLTAHTQNVWIKGNYFTNWSEVTVGAKQSSAQIIESCATDPCPIQALPVDQVTGRKAYCEKMVDTTKDVGIYVVNFSSGI